MRIGIICPSEIALRRFMPALQSVENVEYVGLGVCTKNTDPALSDSFLVDELKKAQKFIDLYGGKIFDGYERIIYSDEIDAIYIPLPPALHFKWAKLALECGKHVLVEKPSTLSAADSKILTEIADKNGLALHENYMFAFHKQLDAIDAILQSGEIGEVRLYRICFGFPIRGLNDFRYNKILGGGALIDAGGYVIKYASRLLGESAEICYAHLNGMNGFEVDMYGSGALVNDTGVTAQISFGMDNNYKCELEVWGSKGCLTTERVFTAPAGFVPAVKIRKGNKDEMRELPADDTFKKSIQHFIRCVTDNAAREDNYQAILKQAVLVDSFYRKVSPIK